ncbi:MAG: DNA repair protein RadC, partial [Thermoplasmatales archaeon]|nr:DNA repair protein RadC [Thermoplasmatales archaeon]
EYFKCLYLDSKNRVIKNDTISVGSLNANIVHPREVFKVAISESAASVILVHNHPSGDPKPSKDDVEITKRLMETGEVIGIKVLDHMIIGDGRWVSLKEEKLI